MRHGLGLAMLGALFLGCGGGGGGGAGGGSSMAPSGPIHGDIDGTPLAVKHSLAVWEIGNQNRIVYLSSYDPTCAQNAIPPDDATAVLVFIRRDGLEVGTYPIGETPPESGTVGVSVGKYPYTDAGLPTTWSDTLGGPDAGTVWLTGVSSTEIDGAISAHDDRNHVTVSGAFHADVCPDGDGGT